MNEFEDGISPERATPWQGMFWPLLSFGGGLIAYFLLFGLLVDPLSPPVSSLRDNTYDFLWEGDQPASRAAILAADINARYAVAIPSVLMALAFLATLVLAFVLVLPRFGRWALALGAVALPIGGLVGYFEQYNNPLRASVTNCNPASGQSFCPLDQAVARAGDLGTFDESRLQQITLLTHWNSIASVAAIFLFGICFLFIARRATEDELAPDLLRRRRRALSTCVMLGGLVLVFSVATAHAFYHIAPALMAEDDAEPYAALALAGSTYWGAVYTTVMLVIAAPAAASIIHDIRRAGERHLPQGDFTDRLEWRKRHGLSAEMRDTLGPLVASLTPVLTAPALNALRPLLPGG